MMPIHYCFLTGVYHRDDALMYYRQGRSLASVGYRVSYVLCDGLPDEYKDGIFMTSTEFVPSNRRDKFFRTSKIILKKALEMDADIYQISDPGLLGIVKPLKIKGKKVIFNVRELYYYAIQQKYYLPIILRKLIASLFNRRMVSVLKQCDAVFVVDVSIVDFFSNYGVPNVHLITNFPLIRKDYRISYQEYVERGDVLCYEGTIYKDSRQENFFDALEKIPQMRYLMAGVIEDKNEQIREHPYWVQVNFIGKFSPNDLPSIFSKASICHVTRDLHGMDGSLGILKIYESMEAALPVLLPDAPLYKRMLEDYPCGICVNPNDKKAIYDALSYLAANKEEAYKMGQEGRRAVLEKYSWDCEFEKYHSIIEQVAKEF